MYDKALVGPHNTDIGCVFASYSLKDAKPVFLFIYSFIWREQRKECFTDEIRMQRSLKM